MRYASAPPFRKALEAWLGSASRAGGPSLARLRKEVVLDRLLARLVAAAPGRWMLKGALALDHRFGDRARTTRDVDLAMRGDEASATADLLAAQALDLGDFFSFAVKDLVDLALIAGEAALDARRLRAAIDVTFRHRATHPLPARLPRPAADWRVPYGRMCRDIGLDPDLGAGHDLAIRLVDPVLAGEVVAGTWDPAARSWRR